MKVTILTPTYNRKHTLPKLYDSLVKQTNKNFEWLIIDDGSEDNTKDYISELIKENKINIRYFYKENGGKHRALNYGISLIKNELTFMVDSDDWISENAIDRIIFYANKYNNVKNIGVFSFLKAFPNNVINGPKYKKDEYVGNYIDERLNNKNWGDKAEVCFTDALKSFPLPEIDNEKFISEGYLWFSISDRYDTVYINEVIYYADYLSDGLTKNIYKIRVKNPKGCIEVAHLLCSKKCNLNIRYKNAIKYIAYSMFDKRSFWVQIKSFKYKFLYVLAFFPGILFYLYVKFKVKRDK